MPRLSCPSCEYNISTPVHSFRFISVEALLCTGCSFSQHVFLPWGRHTTTGLPFAPTDSFFAEQPPVDLNHSTHAQIYGTITVPASSPVHDKVKGSSLFFPVALSVVYGIEHLVLYPLHDHQIKLTTTQCSSFFVFSFRAVLMLVRLGLHMQRTEILRTSQIVKF